MGTKMKGVMKGLRYISQIFEEDKKKQEMKIGSPTDVKHVAHIGWDGPSPSVDNTPSWMKEFKSTEEAKTAGEETKGSQEMRLSSQDSTCERGSRPQNKATRNLPKSSKRPSLAEGSPTFSESPKSSKTRQSKRNSSNSSKPTRIQKDSGSPSPILSVLPKKSSRKKSKETSTESSSKLRKKVDFPSNSYLSPYSDRGKNTHESTSMFHKSSLRPSLK